MQSIIYSEEPDFQVFESDNSIIGVRLFRFKTETLYTDLRISSEKYHVLSVCVTGTGYIHIDHHGGNYSFTTKRDQCFFLPIGQSAEIKMSSDSSYFSIFIPDHFMKSINAAPYSASFGIHLPKVGEIMSIIEDELKRPSVSSSVILSGLARAAISIILIEDRPMIDKIHIHPAKLKRVIKFVDDNLHEKISLEDLAAVAGLSVNHFVRVFKHETGQTPYKYVKQRRLEHARRLLETNIPLAELALECGFANQAHFTHAFSREMGIPPGKFRKTA